MENKLSKGRIYLIENFQEFGQILIQLENKLTKNIEGDKLKIPLWEGFVVDANHKGFREFIQEARHLSLCCEENLIQIEGEN